MDSSLSSASLILDRCSGVVVREPPVGRSLRMEEMILSDGDGSMVEDSTLMISSVLESEGKSSAMSDMKVAVVVDDMDGVRIVAAVFMENASVKNTLFEARVATPTMMDSDSL